MEKQKLRVGFVTSSLLVKTGFSNNARYLIPYLYKTDKYEIFHLNQGIGDDPNLQRFPWHNEGVFRKGTFDENRFNSNDEGFKRHISYGNEAVESWIIRNKLDVVIHQEDVWSANEDRYIKSKWWKELKENFLMHSTADSTPILPAFKTYAENCPNVWFWTSFAEKSLKKENLQKYGHVKTCYGCVNTDDYKPITPEERYNLRKEFNIDIDTKIFIQLGRLQLRKLYPQTIESFAKFKKQYPNYKCKLLFHCNFSEPNAWPLERLAVENGLKKDDILTTYYCRHCGKWEIKPFSGEDQNCRYCGKEKSQITAGVTSTISNKDISKIYGISDAAVSVFTSGGFEYFSCESLLCGLPLLCTNYSCGEDFCAQPFVFTLDGTFTYEVGTGFQKHVPNINTMVKFYKTICDMPEDKRKEIGRKGREWAKSKFDISVIGPIFEEWLDSRKKITWDFTYKPEPLKDPNAQIPQIQDNLLWLKTLYSSILKMDVKDDDQGLISWLNNLKNGQSRNDIERFFRETANTENQKISQSQPSIQTDPILSLIEENGNKRFLITAPESCGDLVNITALLKSFKTQYSEFDLYLACKPEFNDIFLGNQYLFKVIPFNPLMQNEILMTGRGNDKVYFHKYCYITSNCQAVLNYLTNDRIALELENKNKEVV